jgi:N-acetylmuramoyl-L-alanine amidase
MVAAFDTEDRGLKYARFAVLLDLPCPGILVESAFLSNRAEASRVADPAFRQRLAEVLVEGIEAYGARLPVNRH